MSFPREMGCDSLHMPTLRTQRTAGASEPMPQHSHSGPERGVAPLLLRNRAPLREIPLWLANSRAAVLGLNNDVRDSEAKGFTQEACAGGGSSIRSLSARHSKKRRVSAGYTVASAELPGASCTSPPPALNSVIASTDESSASTSAHTPASPRAEWHNARNRLRSFGQRTAHALLSLRPHRQSLNSKNSSFISPARLQQWSSASVSSSSPLLVAPDTLSAPCPTTTPQTVQAVASKNKRKRRPYSPDSSGSSPHGSGAFRAAFDNEGDKENRPC